RMLIAMRRRHAALRRREFFRGSGPNFDMRPDVIWHGTELLRPDFGPTSRTLAFALDGTLTERLAPETPDRDFYVACNAWIEPLDFLIPPSPTERRWHRIIDTARPSPEDIVERDRGPIVPFHEPLRVEA